MRKYPCIRRHRPWETRSSRAPDRSWAECMGSNKLKGGTVLNSYQSCLLFERVESAVNWGLTSRRINIFQTNMFDSFIPCYQTLKSAKVRTLFRAVSKTWENKLYFRSLWSKWLVSLSSRRIELDDKRVETCYVSVARLSEKWNWSGNDVSARHPRHLITRYIDN